MKSMFTAGVLFVLGMMALAPLTHSPATSEQRSAPTPTALKTIAAPMTTLVADSGSDGQESHGNGKTRG